MKGKIINESECQQFQTNRRSHFVLMYETMYTFNHSLRTSRGETVYKLRLHAIAITHSDSVKNNDMNLITSMYCEHMISQDQKKMY